MKVRAGPGVERGQGGPRVGDHADLDGDRRAHLVGVHVYLDHGLVPARERVALGRHLAQAAADDEDEVRLFQSLQRLRRRAEREVSQVVRVLVGEDVLPAERRRRRRLQTLSANEIRASRAPLCPTAGDDDGPARGAEPADDGPDLLRVRARNGRGLDPGFGIRGDLFAQHVGGQGQHYGSRTARGRDPQAPRDELGEAVGAVYGGRPLGDRGVERGKVHLLERLPAEKVGLHLAEQDEHRRRVLHRRVDPDREVGRADAPRRHGHGGHPGQLGVRLGHKRGARLVAGRDQGQVRVPLGGVQDLQKALPWHGVQAPDSGPRQNLGRDKTRLASYPPSVLRTILAQPRTGVIPLSLRTSYTLALR